MIIAAIEEMKVVIMGKHLFIIRHAKSDWSLAVRDFDRPLNERGFRDAPIMASRLASHSIRPQFILSSPAKRALTTAQIFAKQLAIPNKLIQTEERIYEAPVQTLLQVINQLNDQFEQVAIFGHNPGFSELASYLSKEDYLNLPTCALVHLEFPDADQWSEVSAGTGSIAQFWYPNDGHTVHLD